MDREGERFILRNWLTQLWRLASLKSIGLAGRLETQAGFLCHSIEAEFFLSFCFQDLELGTSLVAQWLRIHLPMQGTRVRALVREDPTCRGATQPVRHNY